MYKYTNNEIIDEHARRKERRNYHENAFREKRETNYVVIICYYFFINMIKILEYFEFMTYKSIITLELWSAAKALAFLSVATSQPAEVSQAAEGSPEPSGVTLPPSL